MNTQPARMPKFTDYLAPNALLFCTDALSSTDGATSLIRLIDQYAVAAFPFAVPSMFLVAEFRRNESLVLTEHAFANLQYGVKIINPAGEQIPLGSYLVGPIDEQNPWFSTRLMLNLSGGLTFRTPGIYKFVVFGSVGENEPEDLISANLLVKALSPVDGLYTASFTSQAGASGQGMVQLFNGRFMGNDASYQYEGSYIFKDKNIAAKVNIKRYAPGPAVFSLDAFNLECTGSVNDDKIELRGSVPQLDGAALSILLTRVQPPQQSSPVSQPIKQ